MGVKLDWNHKNREISTNELRPGTTFVDFSGTLCIKTGRIGEGNHVTLKNGAVYSSEEIINRLVDIEYKDTALPISDIEPGSVFLREYNLYGPYWLKTNDNTIVNLETGSTKPVPEENGHLVSIRGIVEYT